VTIGVRGHKVKLKVDGKLGKQNLSGGISKMKKPEPNFVPAFLG
jgi:hypothetical protein